MMRCHNINETRGKTIHIPGCDGCAARTGHHRCTCKETTMKSANEATIIKRLLAVLCCTDHGDPKAIWPPRWRYAFQRATKCATCRRLLEIEVAKMVSKELPQ